ncbi:DNA repair protein complementing XP-A cells homolog isoform X2 [Chrysoperla carnea]|uniref:DNA repair protein complementing XP-A cells homolog isoform X2 n=1 Tax=Chrysoperla carnea TaxID=189513 RepID=UPI001D061483|nr:DNA repair protein complementing XP-A cells homolog isoform X2 [Chrysoperla carnea]
MNKMSETIEASSNTETNQGKDELTEEQKQRIEQNRLKALEIRKRKLVAHPYSEKLKKKTADTDSGFSSFFSTSSSDNILKVAGKKVIDSGGGFLIEEEDDDELLNEALNQEISSQPPPIIEFDRPPCLECNKKFATSYLMEKFDYTVCDDCYDKDDKHALITKTDAKKEYLLKDCDIDKRDPPLKYIERKNPHNQRWGTMKLYLQIQIEKRALEVWGSEETLREELDKRDEKRVLIKTKKYQKEMKELRKTVRSSLFDNRTNQATHVHKFGPESYNEEDDIYSHTCLTCNFVETFEKM